MNPTNFRTFSWTEFQGVVKALSLTITSAGTDFSTIAGIPRGGLVPAVMLSHALDVPLIPLPLAGEKTIVVDDITDYGETFLGLTKTLPHGAHTASLLHKPRSKFRPHFIGQIVANDDWVVFPWEDYTKAFQDYRAFQARRGT